jgi:CRP-like cAMP-binding protein
VTIQEDLNQIVMLTYLSEPMRENLARIIDILQCDKGEVIFREGEAADRFYMLRQGSILLEQRISENVTACVGSIKPGYSFGWSAMVEDGLYTTDAVCVELSEVLSFKRDKICKLFRSDPEMGFRFYQRLLIIIKKRLDYRTEQFRRAIMHHPDMQQLFCD